MKDVFLSKLKNVQGNGERYRACCPSHDSKGRTLSLLFASDGRILIHCHAGCTPNEVVESIGLTMSDLFPDGAIRDFMASVQPTKKEHKYDAWLELFNENKKKLKPGERFSEKTLEDAREMYARRKNERN